MEITITEVQNPTHISILHLNGKLDGSNSESLIAEAKKLHAAGVCRLILDMSKLAFISSAGLGALHQVALLFREKSNPDQEESYGDYRWDAYRGKAPNKKLKTDEHVKLLSPIQEVREVLDMIGFSSLFEIYTDLRLAKASFDQTTPAIDSPL
jgi:hypothetical protein